MADPTPETTGAHQKTDNATTAPTQSYAGMATSAAGTAAETATNAAVGVKDTMFSMFGGGAKKDTGDDAAQDEEQDRSGSAKAQKEKAKEQAQVSAREGGEDNEAVRIQLDSLRTMPISWPTSMHLDSVVADTLFRRMTPPSHQKFTSSPWSI